MTEVGGYLQFPTYKGKMLYEDGILLNSCRNCLEFIIKDKQISTMYLPYYICDAVDDVCIKNNVKIIKYHINHQFQIQEAEIPIDSYVLVVNWFGVLSKKYLQKLSKIYKLIVDNTQCYFRKPIKNTYTIYSCRKFFGVPDGGVLYGNLNRDRCDLLEKSYSYNNVIHLLGRFEKSASEFYNEFLTNEKRIKDECLMKMSFFTYNILHSLNYKKIKKIRTQNYNYYNKHLKDINQININSKQGVFSYPFLHKKADAIKKRLLKEKIYIPTLWPNCLDLEHNNVAYIYSKDILPLPCNQDCNIKDLDKIIKIIKEEVL